MILWRHLGREIFQNFAVSLLVLNVLLVLTRLATLLVSISTERLYASDYIRLMAYLSPYFLAFTIPLAALTAVVLTFMRLSQDQEILALLSLGIPFRRLLPPVGSLAILALILTFIVTLRLLPWSKGALRDFLFELTKRQINQGLPPKKFVNWIPGMSIFVQEAWHGGKNFALVFMVDQTDPAQRGLIFASQGRLQLEDHKVVFKLYNGCIHLVNKDYSRTEELRFKEYVYRLDLARFEQSRSPSRGELSLSELKSRAQSFPPHSKKRRKYLVEYWKRLAFPGAALILTLLGAPLGASMKASGKGAGLGLAAGLFLFYYFLLSAGANLAQKGLLAPPLALNLPNICLGTLALVLIWGRDQGKWGQNR